MPRRSPRRAAGSSLWAGQLLCICIVLFSAWPALEHPRLVSDDYRYLARVQQLCSGGGSGPLAAGVVENRWDHLWFVDEPGRVRFFRPTVLLSYAADARLWRGRLAFGLTATNVALHLACSLLVGLLLWRWLGPGLTTVASTALFAGLASHGECIWYVAGRTDTLAALGTLAALSLHVAGRDRPALRAWALPCFVLALLSKETAIALPVLALLHDRWVERRAATWSALWRDEWPLYASYAAVTLAVLGSKQAALAGDPGDLVFPYLVSPLHPDFAAHLWQAARSYAGSLVLAEVTHPFAGAAEIAPTHGLLGLPTLLALVAVAAARQWRDGRLWFLLAFGIGTWLPVSFVYVSERFLYLPSVAFVGLLGLLVQSFTGRARRGLAVGLLLFAAFHAGVLHEKHARIARLPGSMAELEAQLAPVAGTLPSEASLLLVNLPGDLLRAQFAEEILRVLTGDPALSVRVLTTMPGQNPPAAGEAWGRRGMGAGLRVVRAGPDTLHVVGGRSPEGRSPDVVQEVGKVPFGWASLATGSTHTAPDLQVRVVSGRRDAATHLEFRLAQPLERYRILLWDTSDTGVSEPPWGRRAGAKARLLRLR